MAILIVATDRDVTPLQNKIHRLLGDKVEVWAYPHIPDPAAVEMVILWKHPTDLLTKLPQLGLISSLGAGVEHILNDPFLPAGIPITRIVDEALTVSMRNYVLMCVLNIHKQFLWYIENQREKRWLKPAQVEIPMRIGVLGLGALGSDIACSLAKLGFTVLGYSQSYKQLDGVSCLNSSQPLTKFMKQINALICILPSTPATKGILNYELFQHLPKGSALINVARGIHLVEEDLIRAMQEGYINQAYLDVFQKEPLPQEHPFWTQSGIIITPHIASITNQDNAAAIVAENYRRWKKGDVLRFEVDSKKGY